MSFYSPDEWSRKRRVLSTRSPITYTNNGQTANVIPKPVDQTKINNDRMPEHQNRPADEDQGLGDSGGTINFQPPPPSPAGGDSPTIPYWVYPIVGIAVLGLILKFYR